MKFPTLITTTAIIASLTPSSRLHAQDVAKAAPAVTVCPAKLRALATYETLADVPAPFEKVALPKALSADEPIANRVARSGATGSTIVDVPDEEQNADEKKAIADGTAVRVMHTQPVRVFADTARINTTCRPKQ